MSLETQPNLRLEDQEAARALMMQEPLLAKDPYAKRVIESGLADNHKEVDIGDFLATRLAAIKEIIAQHELDEIKKRNPDTFEAAYSVRPDLEQFLN